MIDQLLMELEKKGDSQVPEMVEKTVIDAMKTCAVEAPDGPVQSTVSLAICSAVGNIRDEGVVASRMQRAAMSAVVHN